MRRLSIVFFVIFAVSLAGTTIEVPGDFDTIQNAVNQVAAGDTVLVHPGVYNCFTLIGNEITVTSEYIFDPDPNIIINTIINGPENSSILIQNGENNSTLINGFSITACNSGITCSENSSPTISNNYIFQNQSNAITCNNDSSPHIISNRIYDNEESGIYSIDGSSPIIIDNYLFDNGAPGIHLENDSNAFIVGNDIIDHYSKGIFIANSTVIVEQNFISNSNLFGIHCDENVSGYFVNNIIDDCQWGIFLDDSSNVNIIGNLISNSNKDGIYMINSQPVIINTTIVNGGYGLSNCGALYIDNSSPQLINSIIWGNDEDIIFDGDESSLTLQNSLIQTSSLSDQYINAGNNLLDVDPLFLTETNFRLEESSPCHDTGTINLPEGISLPDVDLGGFTRISGSNVDMGAYEWNEQYDSDPHEIVTLDEIGLSNYPNPFNPTTTINFNLPANIENPKIEIYNVRGQLVQAAHISAQKDNFIWNGDKYSSGIYMYQITGDNFRSKSQKMTLIK